MKVVFSTQAKASLREIAFYTGRDDKTRALSFVQALRSAAEQHGSMPRAFALVPRYEHLGIRRCPHGNYLIFYRVEDSRISIVHIMHGARDYEAMLFAQQV